MSNHKIGDRVRVNCPPSPCHNHEATVTGNAMTHSIIDEVAHRRVAVVHTVDVEGFGQYVTEGPYKGLRLAFEPHELIPIVPPVADWRDTEWAKDLMNHKFLEGIL